MLSIPRLTFPAGEARAAEREDWRGVSLGAPVDVAPPTAADDWRSLAKMRASVVLPVPRGPVSRIACGMRPERIALRSGVVTWVWPVTSSKVSGRHFLARTS